MSLDAIKSQGFLSGLLLAVLLICSTPAAALQQLQVGMESPDLSFKGMAGEARQFSQIRGEKLTALVFWSTWSSKSEAVLLRMQKLYELYRGKGFSVIAVNVDEPQPSQEDLVAVKAVVEKLKLTFPVQMDDGLAVFHDLGVIAVPTTVILDAGRMLKYELSGYPSEGAEAMVDFLAEAMEGKKPAGAVVQSGHQPTMQAVRAFNTGNSSMKSRRLADSAPIWFKKAIQADPEFVLPRIALGKYYVKRGDADLAQAEFEQALSREPNNVMALCELGMLESSKGRANEAKVLIDAVLKSADSYPVCFSYAGLVYGRTGNVEKALALFDEGARLDPRNVEALIYRAKMLEEKNRSKDAADSYKQALELILKLH